eukprot:COSAG05_NODE_8932_length_660_cov_1.035651_1_plen_92_part_00
MRVYVAGVGESPIKMNMSVLPPRDVGVEWVAVPVQGLAGRARAREDDPPEGLGAEVAAEYPIQPLRASERTSTIIHPCVVGVNAQDQYFYI